MTNLEFRPWPKIARLNRDIVVTEKIDGTNAAVVIDEEPLLGNWVEGQRLGAGVVVHIDGRSHLVGAQSRSRIITPEQDNFGFAAWVYDNATVLKDVLGPGYHFGEWWGSGIQRGYGLPRGERRFSLFNTKRWYGKFDPSMPFPADLDVVPVLYEGPFYQDEIDYVLKDLRERGSKAAPFMNPEGIVVYHTAANQMFKITLAGDEAPKSVKAA